MGHHSSEQQWPYYRSLMGWLVPWILIAAVVGIAVWVAVDFLGQGELEAPPPTSDSRPAGADSPSPSASPDRKPGGTKSPRPDEKKRREGGGGGRQPGEQDTALITEDVTVQVLNGTASPDSAAEMGDRLGSLGYEVVAIESASGAYPRTVVYWSFPQAQEAAEALAERFGWRSGPKPVNLSSTVDLHVVVGVDEA